MNFVRRMGVSQPLPVDDRVGINNKRREAYLGACWRETMRKATKPIAKGRAVTLGLLLVCCSTLSLLGCSGEESHQGSARPTLPSPPPLPPRKPSLSISHSLERITLSNASSYAISGVCDSSISKSVNVHIVPLGVVGTSDCLTNNTFSISLDVSTIHSDPSQVASGILTITATHGLQTAETIICFPG